MSMTSAVAGIAAQLDVLKPLEICFTENPAASESSPTYSKSHHSQVLKKVTGFVNKEILTTKARCYRCHLYN